MKMFLKYTTLVLLMGSMLFIGWESSWADGNPGDYLQSRTYVGVVGISVSGNTTGLFSGQNYSRVDAPAYDISLIPSLPSALGWGLLFGHREQAYALELSYWCSVHKGAFGPAVITSNYGSPVTFTSSYPETTVYNSINVDFKRYFLTDLQLQPFLDLGVSFPWLDINDADMDSSGDVLPLTLSGIGFNVGVGLEYYITPNFSLVAGAYQRWTSFSQFHGSQVEYNTLSLVGPNTSTAAGGVNFAVGTTVGFE